MTALSPIHPYLGSLQALANHAASNGRAYVEPALKNLGAIAIPIVREVISPASFRNTDPEVTDITVEDGVGKKVRRVRAVANKFKYGERRRGLQVLRHFGAGGAMALNRTEFQDTDPASKGYDLNTLVFGDSANRGKYVLPVKAGVQYSDAISLAPYSSCVDETFHNRAAEDGSLWDAAEGKNSVNLFSRHYVVPGTLLLQVLTINGRTLPPEALEHALLCIGLAGAYGGQTSIYGVNVRNHVVGVFAARMERAIASPYEAVRQLPTPAPTNAAEAVAALEAAYAAAYPIHLGAAAATGLVTGLVGAVEAEDASLRARYRSVHGQVGAFFDAWFAMSGSGATRGKAAKGKSVAVADGSTDLLADAG